MGKMAVSRLSDGVVINLIVAEEDDIPPDGTRLIPVDNAKDCDIGWVFDGEYFVGQTIETIQTPTSASDGN